MLEWMPISNGGTTLELRARADLGYD